MSNRSQAQATVFSLFNIKAGEGRVVGLLLLHSLFNGWAISLSCSAAFALFLTAYGAEQLPWAYILAAGMLALTGYVHRSLEHRFAFGPLFMGLLAFLVLTLGGIWIGFRLAPAGGLAFAGLIWFQVAFTLMGLEFWGVAGRLLTLQQGKRLFGLIGAGDGLANVLGYALVPVLVGWMGTVNLLALAVVSLLGSLVTLYLLTPYTREPALARPARPRRAAKPDGVPVPPMRLPYVQWIAVAHLLGLVLYFLLEFGFMQQVDAYYPDADALAAFLGIVGAFAYGGGLLLQIFGAGRLLQRFGLRFGILSLPVGVLLPLAAAALGGSSLGSAPWLFWGVVVAYALNDLLLGGLFGPSFKLLYQPLDRRTRLLAQSLVESVFEPVGIALAGVALLGLQMVTGFTVVGLTYLLILLAGVWIAATVWAYRGYLATLKQTLTARLLDGGSLQINDAASLATVQAKLESLHPGEVVYALELLQQAEIPLSEAQLTRLLAHDEPLVRSATLAGLVRPASDNLLDLLQRMVESDPNTDVRGAAMQSWARLNPTETVQALLPYATQGDGSLREAALVAVLRYGGISGVLATGGHLLQMVESDTPGDRVAAAHVLGRVESNGFFQPLLRLLADDNVTVVRAALRAAGTVNSPHLLPSLMTAVASPQLGRVAATALARMGDAALSPMGAAFSQPHANPEVMVRLAQVLGQIGSPKAVELLRQQIGFPDPSVRTQVLHGLNRAGFRPNGQAQEEVAQQIQTESAGSVRVLTAMRDAASQPLLLAALGTDLHQTVNRLFYLLSFLHHPAAIMQARDTYLYAAADKRSYALEVLDVTLTQEQKRLFQPLIQELTVEERLRALGVGRSQPLARVNLYQIPDPHFSAWTQACALHILEPVCGEEVDRYATAALTAQQPLVREAALWALARLGGSHDSFQSMIHDPDPQVARVAQTLIQPQQGGHPMLSTIEKVIILRTVDIFSQTADAILAKIAQLLEEVTLQPGEGLFEVGDPGNSTYIIVSGQVRVHIGERDLDLLGEREVFGEMATLDPAPRSASVTATEVTLLLRLDQEPLFDLMESRSEVAQGIMLVVIRRLRMRVADLTATQDRLAAVTEQLHQLSAQAVGKGR